MNFNSGLTKILVEVGTGIVSGMLIEILLTIVSYIFFFIVLSLFAVSMFIGTAILNKWDQFLIFCIFYLPFLLFKVSIWWLLSTRFFWKIGSSYFDLGHIYIIVFGLIGFYVLVYWNLQEILLQAKYWEWEFLYHKLQNLFGKIPPPPLMSLLLGRLQ